CKLEVLEANESINVWIMQACAELINRHRLWNERLIEWSLHNVLIVQVVRKQSYSPATRLQSAAQLNHTAIFTEIQSLCLHKDLAANRIFVEVIITCEANENSTRLILDGDLLVEITAAIIHAHNAADHHIVRDGNS